MDNKLKKVAIIGTGTMGTALAHALCRTVDPREVVLTNRDLRKAERLAQELGCSLAATNAEAAQQAEFVVYCIKPQFLGGVLEETAPCFSRAAEKKMHQIIISIAAGVDVETYYRKMGLN